MQCTPRARAVVSLILLGLVVVALCPGCGSTGSMAYLRQDAAPGCYSTPCMAQPCGAQINTEAYAQIQENAYALAAATPLSTFSINVDTASYSNVRRFLLDDRQLPPKDAVRIEELVNYFTFDDPAPRTEVPININTEVAACAWNPQHKLVRIGLRAKSLTTELQKPRNLVFLVDTSGSMSAPDRLPLLVQGLQLLVETLRPEDRVAIVSYAGSAELVLPSTAGSNKRTIQAALGRLQAGGSTDGGGGIVMAYKIALQSFIPNGLNRVLIGTDGDFNVGVTSESELVRLIEEKRQTGIYLSVLGFGRGNLKDATMEKLAQHGNGHYAYIDTLAEARRVFVEQGAALQVVAQDVKVQVEFNPAHVQSYRLLGYEHRLLKAQDFNNDARDAGDMGAGHTVTALYEIVPPGVDEQGAGVDPLKYQRPAKLARAAQNGELLNVKVRYKEPGAAQSQLLTQPVLDVTRPCLAASEDYRFASAVAAFGLLLRDSPHKGQANYTEVLRLARGSLGADLRGQRHECVQLMEAAQRLSAGQRD